jgi:very-short-patch-repair endonuclease
MKRNTNPTTLRARVSRKADNPAERALWAVLKGRQLNGYKFTRQMPIGPYFADFVCHARRLVIGVDGSQHLERAGVKGERKEATPLSGTLSLRVPSGTFMGNRSAVCETIVAVLEGRIDNVEDAPDLKFRRAS